MFLFKVDGCTNYTVLNETDRAQGSTSSPYSRSDNNLVTGWYRFRGAAGDRMPDKCVLLRSCGTIHPGWLHGTHPTVAEGVVKRKVCFTRLNSCCNWSHNITVKNCSGYYVYRLMNTTQISVRRGARYCGNAGDGKLH